MIKILFLINTLGGGGAERVMVNLINNMDKSKFDITVCTMFADGVNKKMLCEDVKYYCKNKLGIRGLSNFIKYIPAKVLYKYYIGNVKYDIIVAYMHGAPTKVVSGCTDKKIKTVSWLHNGDPETGSFFDFWISKKHAIIAYQSLDAIVGVSKSVSEAFSNYTKITEKIYTIYNTNETEKIIEKSRVPYDSNDEKFPYPIICTAGRLSKEKGFDRLIKIAVQLFNEGLYFKLKILGDGPEKKRLQEIIKKNNANSYIEMLGFCENPYNIMAHSQAFICSSYSEGLATVITEALILGLPVVSTDVSGAKEILGENNEYGLVVQNTEEGIYSGLKKIIKNDEIRKHYAEVSQERAKIFETKQTVFENEKFFESL